MHAKGTNGNGAPAEPTVLEAAKVVVALSGWGRPQGAPEGCQSFMTSAMAIAVLKGAIEREENPPLLRLAPEPLPIGSV